MPRREDERTENLRGGGLRYCVFCKKYYSATEWAFHPHNPEYGRPIGRLKRLLRRFGLGR